MRLQRFATLLAGLCLVGCSAATDVSSASGAPPVFIKLEVEDFGGMANYKSAGAGPWTPRMAWFP